MPFFPGRRGVPEILQLLQLVWLKAPKLKESRFYLFTETWKAPKAMK